LLAAAALEGQIADLRRQADALEVEQPLLVVLFMGGTGVGKSTLLNALARAPVAMASFHRPTTREPVVYYHESFQPDRLDPILRQCRLVAHDRADLRQKILVDTPDLDSNESANRDKLFHLLPVADIVLYVGSQEKYHDRLGWDLFRAQRRRRAFAFVLNKWDRCSASVTSGVRPDEDLLRDLKQEGFDKPLLFRTCAQLWADADGRTPDNLPAGEQFSELLAWLELGLNRLEIEAIKARGVGQLLGQVEQTLGSTMPPDLRDAANKTKRAWDQTLQSEATAMAESFLGILDPHQRDVEKYYSLQTHRRFRGLMASFLQMGTRLRFLGSHALSKFPIPLRTDVVVGQHWDMTDFAQSCSTEAADKHLDARSRALPNQLLVKADREGFPISLLADSVEAIAKHPWRAYFSNVLSEVMQQVEQLLVQPQGGRKLTLLVLVWLGDLLPILGLTGTCTFLLYRYFGPEGRSFELMDLVLPFATVLLTLVLLYVVVIFALPVRWPAIRGVFEAELVRRLRQELDAVYLQLPAELAEALFAERKHMEKLIDDTKEVLGWLRDREQASTVKNLYGDDE
jgi:energy-coupling factor transporter ATP-binding protein EcfA2